MFDASTFLWGSSVNDFSAAVYVNYWDMLLRAVLGF